MKNYLRKMRDSYRQDFMEGREKRRRRDAGKREAARRVSPQRRDVDDGR